jgi:hypothetical protein
VSPVPEKVVFVVSVAQHGMGGHYHSLAAIAGSLFAECPERAMVVSIGGRRSPVVESLVADGIRVEHIDFHFAGLRSAVRRLETLVSGFGADVIHAFDEHAFLFARVVSARKRVPTLLTKCGGPVPKGYFPRTRWLSVFSEEDARFFASRENTEVWKIPNRVRYVQQDMSLISDVRERVGGGLLILRVTRIAPHYEKTLEDSMRIVRRLRRDGLDAKLVVIGHVYDRRILERALEEAGDFVFFITDERFCRDAKRVIGVADIVIGTGRSLMEAVVLGKSVLCPVQNMEIPCLVSPENVGVLAATNFSERGRLETGQEEEYQRVRKRCVDGQDSAERGFLRDISSNYCDVAAAMPRYRAIYRRISGSREHFGSDVLVHAAKVLFVFGRLAVRRRFGRA